MVTLKHNLNSTRLEQFLRNRIKNINKLTIEVGFIDGATYEDGTSVAQVAMKNNLGTIEIPPRPFFTIAIKKNKKKWINYLKNGIINGKGIRAAKKTGEMIRKDIVKEIIMLDSPPNAPYTIKKKGSSNPLVDTGLMRKSVTYEIKKR